MSTSTTLNSSIARDMRSMLAEVRQLSQAIGSLERRLAQVLGGLEPQSGADALAEANGLIASPLATAVEDASEPDAQASPLDDPAPSDDFTLIEGIDAKIDEILRGLGLTHFKDIAAFNAEDVMLVGKAIGNATQVKEQKWIKQAAILARREPAAGAEDSATAMAPATKEPDAVLPIAAEPVNKGATGKLPAAPAVATSAKVVPASEIDARRRQSGKGWSRRVGAAAGLAAAATGLLLVIQLQQQLPFSTIAKDLGLPANPQLAFADTD